MSMHLAGWRRIVAMTRGLAKGWDGATPERLSIAEARKRGRLDRAGARAESRFDVETLEERTLLSGSAPTLTTISNLTGGTEDVTYTITYAALAAAANEADGESDALSFRVEVVSAGTLQKAGVAVTPGTTLLSTGQSLTWTPPANVNGVTQAFTVKAWDGTGASASAIPVNISLAAVNDAPTLSTISTLSGGTEDTAYTVSYDALLAASNATDVDSASLNFQIAAVTAGTLTKGGVAVTAGTTQIGPGESVVWTPAANANGSAVNAFTVKAHDGTTASSTAVQVKVNLAATPDAPTLTTVTTLTGATEDAPYTITYAALLAAANEASPDGNTVNFQVASVSSGTLTKGGVAVTPGSTTIAAGETLVWTPAANANGTQEAFKIKATDGELSATAVAVNVTITAANDTPTLSNVNVLSGAIEDTAYTITYAALAAASDIADVDGGSPKFLVAAVSTGTLKKGTVAVTAGTTTLGPGETLTWTAAANANGTLNAFTVKANDGTATSASAVQVRVATLPVDDSPTLTTVTTLAGGTEDTPYSITYAALATAANEADGDSGTINFQIASITAGTLTIGGVPVVAGTTVLIAGQTLTWTPAANANGSAVEAFKIKAYDGNTTSATAVAVNVALAAVNDTPTFTTVSNLSGASEDTNFTISYATLLAATNATDVDTGTALRFRVEAVSTGTLTKGGVAVVAGTTTIATGESLVWKGAANANGLLNAFTIKAYDGTTYSSTAVQVKVTVAAVNDAPTQNSTITTFGGGAIDTPYTITYSQLLTNTGAADVDGTTPTFKVGSVTTGTLTKGGVAVVANTTTISAGESLVWTPAAHASGVGLNAFTISAYDGSLAATAGQVKVTIGVTNVAPTLTTISSLAGGSEDTPYTISYAALLAASNAADFEHSAIAFKIMTVASGTTLTKGGVAVTPGTTTLAAGQSLVWTPAANVNGLPLEAFSVVANDGTDDSTTGSVYVNINIAAVNDAPTMTSVTALATGPATEGTPFTVDFADLVTDAADTEGSAISYLITAVPNGTLTKNGIAVVPGTTTIASGESLAWTPSLGGTGVTAFSIKAYDGTTASATAYPVTVDVTNVNDAPTLTTMATISGSAEDMATDITYGDLTTAGNEADEDGDTLDFVIGAVTTGTLTLTHMGSTGAAMAGDHVVAGDTLHWTPAADANGLLNAFTVNVDDGTVDSGAAVQVKVTVAAAEDGVPTVSAGTIAGATEDIAFTISYASLVTATGLTDPDPEETLTFRIESVTTGTLTKGGVAVVAGTTTLTAGQSLVWTPAANANGTAGSALSAFTVKGYDGTAYSASAVQVKVGVTAVNDAPTLTTMTTLTGATEDTAFDIDYADLVAAGNQADVDADTINYQIVAISTGTLTLTHMGSTAAAMVGDIVVSGDTLHWTPAANANGIGASALSAFTVKAHDGTTTSAAAVQVKVAVTAANDAPTLTSVSNLTGATEDTNYSITYTALKAASNLADVDNASPLFRIVSVDTGTLTKGGVAVVAGTTTLGPGETIVWKGAADASGTLGAFTVEGYDGTAASSGTVAVSVVTAAVNDAPTLTTMSTLGPTNEDTPITIAYADLTGAGNEADSDGPVMKFLISAVSSGTLTKGGVAVVAGTTTIAAGESVVWTPAANANGVGGSALNAFTVKANDGTLSSATAVQVKVGVTAVNDAPTLTSVTTLTGGTEDTAYSITYTALAAAANEADVDSTPVNFRIEAVSSGTLTKGGVAVTPGTTTVASGDTLVWTPGANANGATQAFTIKAADGAAFSATAVAVNVNLAAVNDAPTLTSISNLTGATENTPYNITYAALKAASNAADVDGQTISFRIEAVTTGTLKKNGVAVTAGTTLVAPGDALLWTPAANANGAGTNAFTVKASDGTVVSSTAVQVKVNISHTNQSPVFSTISTIAGSAEGAGATDITYAALVAASDASDPDMGDTFDFTIEAISSGTLTLTHMGMTAAAMVSDTVTSGDTLHWTPAADANGTLNAFSLTAIDNHGTATTAQVQVKVSVAADENLPTISSFHDMVGGNEDTPITYTYAALVTGTSLADTDPEQTLVFKITAVDSGTLTKNGVAVVANTTTIAAGESVVWTPAADANGTLAAFHVKGYDGVSLSATASAVTVDVTAVNDAPTVAGTPTTVPGGTEDTALDITYADLVTSTSATDAESDSYDFTVVAITSGSLTLTHGMATGAVMPGDTVTTGDTLHWIPDADANGTLSAFSVNAVDSHAAASATVQIKAAVAAVNDVPTLTTISTLPGGLEDTAFPITFNTLLSASDAADVDSVVGFKIMAVSTGTLTKNGVAVVGGTTLISAGDTVVWTPASNANGTGGSSLNAFTVKAWDGTAASASSIQVKVAVTAVADPPTFSSVSTIAGGTEDTQITIDMDVDVDQAGNAVSPDGNTISYKVVSIAAGSTLVNHSGAVPIAVGDILTTADMVDWTPPTNATGSSVTAFSLKAYDSTGGTLSATAVPVNVNLANTNDAPTLGHVNALQGGTEDTAYTITYAALLAASDANDIDADTLSFRVEAVSTGTLKKGGVAVTPGTTTIGVGESLVWTGAADANGALNAFTVKAYDGTVYSASATQVKIVLAAVNDAPDITFVGNLTTAAMTPLTISYAALLAAVSMSDADAGDTLKFRIVSLNSGTLTKSGTAVTPGTTLVGAGESLVWTPDSGIASMTDDVDGFTIEAWDGTANSATTVEVLIDVT